MFWFRDSTAGGPRVAIVGGGFSGTAVLANLIDLAPAGTMIELFEARGEVGPGTAYGTGDTGHLLNVQAARMGAFNPEHFWHWLSTGSGTAAVAEVCPGRDVQPTDYLPRALYGLYLKDVLRAALERADGRGVSVTITHATMTGACRRRGNPVLELAFEGAGGRRRRRFDVLVLATGNFPPRNPACVGANLLRSPGYVNDVWRPPPKSRFPKRVRRLSRDKTVLILGSGLTAVDAALTLDQQGFKGRIVAVSRHGRLPCAHAAMRPPPWNWVIDPDRVEPTALSYVQWLKQEARQAIADGTDWRAVFDALRPHTQRLWHKLDPEEQVKLLRRHSLWSIHRHRMAPGIAAKIEALRVSGRLEVVAGRVTSVRTWLGGLCVRLRRRGAAKDETLRPSLVLNCTGPETDIAATGSRLLLGMLDKVLLVRSPTGAGIAVEADGTARSACGGRIFAIGPLLVGEAFECTAVPELRKTAKWVARQIAAVDTQRCAAVAFEVSP